MNADTTSRDRRRGLYCQLAGMGLLVMTGCSTLDRGQLTQPIASPNASQAAAPPEPSQRRTSHFAPAADSEPSTLAADQSRGGSDIVQVSRVEPGETSPSDAPESTTSGLVRVTTQQQTRELEPLDAEVDSTQPLPNPAPMPADRYAIDLAAALQLAGASNLQIAVAAEQVRESAARLARAEVMWVPTLNFGAGYNRHDGQIQETDGDVLEVSRSAAFVGGGPKIGDAPLPGMGGAPRLFVGLNPAEAYFQPLAARRAVQAASAERAATFNDTLLEVGLAYYDLTEAQMRIAIAGETVQNAQELVRLTEQFEQAGAGLAADAARARAQLASARMEQLEAEQQLRVNSAELARLLRLQPGVILYPAETMPVPVTLVSTQTALPELIAQGLGRRPELARNRALVAAAQARLRMEQWRPLTPNVQLGNSFGGFGGGPDSYFGNFEARNDFEALAIWQVENFGLGNGARRREAASQQRQECLRLQTTLDRIAAEITQAYARAETSAQQVEVAQTLVSEASRALPLNFRAIRGGQLSPIEAQQAISQLADARRQYLTAVIDYDRSQLELLRAIGNPPDPITVPLPQVPQSVEALSTPPELFGAGGGAS